LGAPAALGLEPGRYVLVTLHRPANVDDPAVLTGIAQALEEIARRVPVVFPVHPRTALRLETFGISLGAVRRIEPVGYARMLSLMERAGAVLTDSGGIQEETTVLGVPCLTLRDTTERPVTVTHGTNRLVPDRGREAILRAFGECWGATPEPSRPDLWDGAAGERVADVLDAWWAERPSPWPAAARAAIGGASLP
jgi:UDP-N-acetylglucosamine 2-epimerase (non-hydrolysing)